MLKDLLKHRFFIWMTQKALCPSISATMTQCVSQSCHITALPAISFSRSRSPSVRENESEVHKALIKK